MNTASHSVTAPIGPGTIRQLIFSGGGVRCFWQGGFMEVVREPLQLQPDRITGVSGGVLSAVCFIADCGPRCLEVMGSAFDRETEKSVTLKRILNGTLPQGRIYREVVSELVDKQVSEAIAEGPQFQVPLARPPAWLPLRTGAYLAMLAYKIDQWTRSNPHMILPYKLGSRRLLVDARLAARNGQLVDLICAAATIPPAFEFMDWPEGSHRKVMDAGTIDNVPRPEPDEGRSLILMTRHYRSLDTSPDNTHVEPSAPVPASKLDFTSRDKIERTWLLGARDGAEFLARNGLDDSGAANIGPTAEMIIGS
jgi:hypothetical protein